MYVHVHVTCKVMKVQCKSQMLIACEQTLASFANALIHQSVKPESRVWVKNPNTVYNTRTCLQAKILHVHVHVNIILVHKSMLMGQLHTYNIKTFMPAINQQQDWVAIATYIIHCVAVLSTISNIEQQLVMVNYACGFNQSEMGKYFEWIFLVKYLPKLNDIHPSSLSYGNSYQLCVIFGHVFSLQSLMLKSAPNWRKLSEWNWKCHSLNWKGKDVIMKWKNSTRDLCHATMH